MLVTFVRIANRKGPDQIWVCTVCLEAFLRVTTCSVRSFRTITLYQYYLTSMNAHKFFIIQTLKLPFCLPFQVCLGVKHLHHTHSSLNDEGLIVSPSVAIYRVYIICTSVCVKSVLGFWTNAARSIFIRTESVLKTIWHLLLLMHFFLSFKDITITFPLIAHDYDVPSKR